MTKRLASGQFYGEIRKNHAVGGFALTEAVYSAGLELPRHAHESSYFCFVLDGGYTESLDGRTHERKPSTLIFHPAGEPHSDSFHAAGGRLFSFEIESRILGRVQELQKTLEHPAVFGDGLLIGLARKLYKEFRWKDEMSPILIECLMLEITAEASRDTRLSLTHNPPVWLARAKDFLHTHFAESITLSSVANAVNIHPVHLAREFRRYYRCTLGEYIRQLRIEFACQNLSMPHLSLVEIALVSGFSSQSHFSTVFKRVTGMSPAHYRSSIPH